MFVKSKQRPGKTPISPFNISFLSYIVDSLMNTSPRPKLILIKHNLTQHQLDKPTTHPTDPAAAADDKEQENDVVEQTNFESL